MLELLEIMPRTKEDTEATTQPWIYQTFAIDTTRHITTQEIPHST